MALKVPIAVVGMAGMFPNATDLDSYWQNIVNKVPTTGEVTRQRWLIPPAAMVRERLEPDKALSGRCCLIDPFDFVPLGFQVDPRILKELDPLYHLVLQSGKNALLQPGAPTIKKERAGVILAALALPTDASSALTRELFSAVYEKKLFRSVEHTDNMRNQLRLAFQ